MRNLHNDRLKRISLWTLVTMAFTIAGCAGWLSTNGRHEAEPPQASSSVIAQNLATSLHATAAGMQWWYEQPGGFGAIIDIPFTSTDCSHCHTTGCSDCHSDAEGAGAAGQPAACLRCHGRQSAEATLGVSDVHSDNGMMCSDCHLTGDIHGDGTAYNSMFQKGAIDADCMNCHTGVSQTQAHTVHADRLHCDACHVSTVTTCYNCHFNTLLEDHQKKAYKKFRDFVILVNDADGKVRTGTYQSVVKESHTFVAFGPFHGHSVVAKGRTCAECHNNERVRELNKTGKIVITRWEEGPETSGIVHTTGVVPFVPDLFEFQFVDYDKAGKGWIPMTTKTGKSQWEFCSPLTTKQMKSLAATK